MSSSRSVLLIGLLALAGCSDRNAIPDTPTFAVTPRATWAGSTVTIQSSAIAAHKGIGTVSLGGNILATTRLDDTTLTVQLPAAIRGAFEPILQIGSWSQGLDSLSIYGYADVSTYPFRVEWTTYAWPRGGTHANIMTSGDDNTLYLIDLDTHRYNAISGALSHGGSGSGMWGPGLTYQPGVFLLQPPGEYPNSPLFTSLQTWSLAGTPQRTDVGGRPIPPVSSEPIWQLMRLGPSAWLVSSKGGSFLLRGTDSSKYENAEQTEDFGNGVVGLYMSPRGDRATLAATQSRYGVPVYSVPDGALAYYVPAITNNTTDADFSPDGSRLLLAGQPHDESGPVTGSLVVEIDATTGQVMHDTAFAATIASVRYDPARPLIYVALAMPSDGAPIAWHPAIAILDRNTFHLVALLAPPDNGPGCALSCFNGRLSISPAGSIYFFWGYTVSTPTSWAWRFTLPPLPKP